MEFDEVDIQAVRFLTADGGTLVSTLNPEITCKLPEGALTMVGPRGFCRVSLQVYLSVSFNKSLRLTSK